MFLSPFLLLAECVCWSWVKVRREDKKRCNLTYKEAKKVYDVWLVWDSKSDWDTREAKVRHLYNWQKNSLNRCDVRNSRSESASDFVLTSFPTESLAAREKETYQACAHCASDPCFIPVGSFFFLLSFYFALVPRRKDHFRIWVNFTPHKMLHRQNARKTLQLSLFTGTSSIAHLFHCSSGKDNDMRGKENVCHRCWWRWQRFTFCFFFVFLLLFGRVS